MVPTPGRREAGSAIVDFVIVIVVLVPVFLGVLQVALTLYVRNVLASAASEGARYGATLDRTPADGAAKARAQITEALGAEYATNVHTEPASIDGAPAVRVVVNARVPALGAFGQIVPLSVSGTAVEESDP